MSNDSGISQGGSETSENQNLKSVMAELKNVVQKNQQAANSSTAEKEGGPEASALEGQDLQKKGGKKRKLDEVSKKPVTISDVAVELVLTSDENSRLLIHLWEGSYPKISFVRERSNEKTREFYLNKNETNQLLDTLHSVTGLIENRDKSSKVYLSSKMNVSMSTIGSSVKVTFTTKTSSSRTYYFNFSLGEWEKALTKLIDIRIQRDWLAEAEEKKKNEGQFFPEQSNYMYVHELHYVPLSLDLSENINGDEQEKQKKYFLHMSDLFDFMDTNEIRVDHMGRKYVPIPKPAWVCRVLCRILKKNSVRMEDLTAKTLAIYVGQFYNTVFAGRFSTHEIITACKNILDANEEHHGAFVESILDVLDADYNWANYPAKLQLNPPPKKQKGNPAAAA